MLQKTSCCGLYELYGLAENPEDLAKSSFFSGDLPALILFSDAIRNGNGERLTKFIKENDLGEVVESAEVKNRNSGNVIKAWLWSPNDNARMFAYKDLKLSDDPIAVGDTVIALAVAEDGKGNCYSITTPGWKGRVIEIDGDSLVVVGLTNSNSGPFDVYRGLFKKICQD